MFIPDAQILQNKLINISNIPDAQVTVKQTNFTTKSDAPVLQEQNKVLISIYLKIIANLCCIELLNSGRFRWTLLTSGATWVAKAACEGENGEGKEKVFHVEFSF